MTGYYTSYSGIVFKTPSGRLGVPPDGQLVAAGSAFLSENGVVVGPIQLQPGGEVAISRLDWPAAGTTIEPEAAAAVGAAALTVPEREERVTRREAITLGLLVAGTVATAGTATADSPPLAALTLRSNPDGLTVRLPPAVEDRRPDDAGDTFTVTASGEEIGEADTNGSITIPPGTTGDVAVSLESGWLSGLIDTPDILADDEPQFDILLSEPPAERAAGETVTLTESTTAIASVREHGPETCLVTIGEDTIPYAEADQTGQWSLQDDRLTYTVGPEPPIAQEGTLTTDLSTVERVIERYT